MKNKAGFTLIEVLVALAIISIALTAIIRSTAQNIKSTLYIQNKMIASWVGTEVINEVRAGLLNPPGAPDAQEDETEMLGQKWIWHANVKQTPNPHIREINVDVSQQANSAKLIHLVSFYYVAK